MKYNLAGKSNLLFQCEGRPVNRNEHNGGGDCLKITKKAWRCRTFSLREEVVLKDSYRIRNIRSGMIFRKQH